MSIILNVENLSSEIIKLRDNYVNDKELKTVINYWHINNGFCVEFAEDIVDVFGSETDDFWIAEAGNFMVGENGEENLNEVWDKALLEEKWGITPPEGFTWEDLNSMTFGHHAWVIFNKRHYDAECPEGVDNFFDLPLYKSFIEYNRLIKKECV